MRDNPKKKCPNQGVLGVAKGKHCLASTGSQVRRGGRRIPAPQTRFFDRYWLRACPHTILQRYIREILTLADITLCAFALRAAQLKACVPVPGNPVDPSV